jgi:hypothetical protein
MKKAATLVATPPSLLQAAEALINGQRQADYGDKLQNFSQIAMIWQGILAQKLLPGARILPEDVAYLMTGMKLARLATTPTHYDSILDIAGYAGCAEKIIAERNDGTTLRGATIDSGNITS